VVMTCNRFGDRFEEWGSVVEVIRILKGTDQFIPKGIEICLTGSRRHNEKNPLRWAPI